ncbi:Uncharacterized protein FWK35_00012461 [Aphis craccivora]|uniref:Uncharacterized protein n=1 Tax=Aphis craccivora TaxID=307492 RepID=A0A6G0XWQ3_APHCR|nr:Uncharacterized protein FWK35_00012461 [Aphis craccivora]
MYKYQHIEDGLKECTDFLKDQLKRSFEDSADFSESISLVSPSLDNTNFKTSIPVVSTFYIVLSLGVYIEFVPPKINTISYNNKKIRAENTLNHHLSYIIISLNDLLFILKKHKCFSMLPKDARTLLGTKPVPILNMHEVKPNQARYWYRWTSCFSKSTSTQFWPILAYIRPNSNLVFPVGLYCGTDKPSDSNEYLNIILDFFSCSRCEIEGEYRENRMCFPYSEPDKRSKTRPHTMKFQNLILLYAFDMPWCNTKKSNIIVDERTIAGSKSRKLEEVCQWKATEFRSFLLYSGPIAMDQINCLNYCNNMIVDYKNTISGTVRLCRPYDAYAMQRMIVLVRGYVDHYDYETRNNGRYDDSMHLELVNKNKYTLIHSIWLIAYSKSATII